MKSYIQDAQNDITTVTFHVLEIAKQVGSRRALADRLYQISDYWRMSAKIEWSKCERAATTEQETMYGNTAEHMENISWLFELFAWSADSFGWDFDTPTWPYELNLYNRIG